MRRAATRPRVLLKSWTALTPCSPAVGSAVALICPARYLPVRRCLHRLHSRLKRHEAPLWMSFLLAALLAGKFVRCLSWCLGRRLSRSVPELLLTQLGARS